MRLHKKIMKNFLFAMLAIALLNSCTKVIDINLNEADPKIVIEAELVSSTQISRSKSRKPAIFSTQNNP